MPALPDETPLTIRGRSRGRLGRILGLSAIALAAWALASSLLVVDVTEYGVVNRFGHIVRILASPGLRIVAPFDDVIRLDKRLLSSHMAPAEYLTIDKKNIVVESLATWRIADPRQFLETVATRAAGDERLADVIQGEIGSVLGRYPAGSLISTTGAASRFRSVVSEIQGRVTHFTQIAYGIEVVDVDIVHLSLPGQNKEHVFERMRAERGKIAKEHRSSGELEAKRIIAEAEREKTRIETEAYVEAERFKAEGDAKASAIYRSAFNRDPGFYKFLRTLQAYEKFVDESTTLFLPAEAEVFEVLRQQAGPGGVPAPWSSAAGPAQDANSASCADPVGSEPGRAGGQLLARNCPGRAP